MFNLTPIVKNLLIINVALFVIPQIFLSNHHLFIELFGLKYVFSENFSISQLASYAVIHASWGHLFSNMFGLIIFGPILEYTFGPKRFLIFYAVTAIGAGLIYSIIHLMEVMPFLDAARIFLENPDPEIFASLLADYDKSNYQALLVFIDQYARNANVPGYQSEAVQIVNRLTELRLNSPMVGASGAIFGIMLGFGYLYPNLQMMLLFPPIPVRAKYLVGFYAIYALYSAVEKVPGDNVAHYAHIGGMLVGYLLIRYWKIKPSYH